MVKNKEFERRQWNCTSLGFLQINKLEPFWPSKNRVCRVTGTTALDQSELI
jgi:hypothetical protein